MVLAAIKKYPSQITSAFKRFPAASAFTFLIFITLVIETNLFSLFDKVFGDNAIKFFTWLAIYPIAAMLIARAGIPEKHRLAAPSHRERLMVRAFPSASICTIRQKRRLSHLLRKRNHPHLYNCILGIFLCAILEGA